MPENLGEIQTPFQRVLSLPAPEIRDPGKSRQQGVSHPEHLLGIESCYLAVFTEPLLCAEGGDNTVTPSPAQPPDTISTPVLTTGSTEGKQARGPCAPAAWQTQTLAFNPGGDWERTDKGQGVSEGF